MGGQISAMRRPRSASSPAPALHLLGLPEDLLLIMAAHLPLEDRVRLACVCRQLNEASACEQLWPELDLDFKAARWATEPHGTALWELHQSLRLWLARRGAGVRSLTITWPGRLDAYPFEVPDGTVYHLQLLVASLLGSLAGSLHSLDHRFSCFVPWADTLIPLGGGADGLRELRIRDCHLPSVAALGALGPSLTYLSISVCPGFAEHEGGVAHLPLTLRRLSLLQHLSLSELLFDTAPASLSALTRLTSLEMDSLDLDSEHALPPSCSTLTRLARLQLTGTGLEKVPAVLQHLTGLRTLLLSANKLGSAWDDDEDGPPQGVPLELSALQQLEHLCLRRNESLGSMPQAFRGLSRLTLLHLGSTGLGRAGLPQGPYLSALQELDLAGNLRLPSASLSALAAASRLRRLSLRGCQAASGGMLLPAVLGLSQMTYLDVGATPVRWFPPGPYAASLQELNADRCAPASDDIQAVRVLSALPPLPRLHRLCWRDNGRLSLPAARGLLRSAPALKVLWVGSLESLTKPAERELGQAGVAVEEHVAAYPLAHTADADEESDSDGQSGGGGDESDSGSESGDTGGGGDGSESGSEDEAE